MRPPPNALTRASSTQSDSLFSLIALANRICRLAAQIEGLDRIQLQARAALPSKSSISAPPSDPALCDFLCPRASSSPAPTSSPSVFSTSRSSRTILGRPSPLTHLERTASASRLASRFVSSATASARHDDSQTDRQATKAYDFLSTSDIGWQRASKAVESAAAPTTSTVPQSPHWTSPWRPIEDDGPRNMSDPSHSFLRMLERHRGEFSPGRETHSEHNGLTLRRLQGDQLWRLYCQHAHREALPLHTRVRVAFELATVAHRVTTNKTESPTSKSIRCLFGRRLNAIVQDCDSYMAAKRRRSALSRPSLLQHNNLNMALLEPMSLALQAKPIAALKALDGVLLRCRPDIYKYKDDASREADFLSSINFAFITIADSINFELDCPADPGRIAQSVRSLSQSFPNLDMVADLKDGLVDLRESDRAQSVFHDSIKWLIESPHAFLLSQVWLPSFRTARFAFLHCLSKARDLHHIISTMANDYDPEDPAFVQACDFLLRSTITNKGPEAALDLYDDFWSRGVPMSPAVIRKIITNARGQTPSARLEALLHRNSPRGAKSQVLPPKLLRAMARTWATLNRPDRVDVCLRELRRRNDGKYGFILRETNLRIHAARGDLTALHDELAQLYDFEALSSEDCAPEKHPLSRSAFRLLLQACNRADDIDLAEHYMVQALERGVELRSADFNHLIDLHVRKTNIDAALAIFEQMKQFGVTPDKFTFTTLIKGFTLRRDPESAAHTLRAMVVAGKIPDRVVYAALLNCFVESGVYDAAIRLFAWMQEHQDVRLRPTIEICNIVLKAYVLSSLPVQKVMQFVNNITKQRLRPNANTYALMLQSACDAGLMHVAEEIFSEAEEMLPDLTGTGPGQGANMYHFTIMIHGYLRLGDHTEAKEYFDEMRNRNLQPSAITWAVMVKSYAESENETNYDLACTLVSQLVADESKKKFTPASWRVPANDPSVTGNSLPAGGLPAGRQSPPFETLFSTLMVAQARRGEPEKVETALKQLSQTTPSLSVYAMTPLLDAYRRVGDIENARQLYERIYEAALGAVGSQSHRVYAYSEADEDKSQPPSPQRRQDASSRNLLCLPVSIMIDLLSNAGRHQEVAEIWSRAKKDGFGFDSDNWNHLAASMARAGQLDEALSVVEHVLHHDPPSSWMRTRSGADLRGRREDGAVAQEDGEDKVKAKDNDAQAEEAAEAAPQQAKEFDPLLEDAELDPAVAHRPDATSPPSHPPNRRHEARNDDDPYVDMPFEVSDEGEDVHEEFGDDRKFCAPEQEEDMAYAEPSAFYLDRSDLDGEALMRDIKSTPDFSPWYAHFGTMEAISRGLAQIREPSKVIALLDRYPTAAKLLDVHERKVERIKQMQEEEAVRSARNLIDGRS